ncbi:DUF7146 domain-containing protein [Pseudomonas neustonica]|uniref:DUF7146 domain-containing protein n=1 Tax=Pseudomonas neustonica TaxID=2487346 RepID=UPI003F46A974|tara:strand:- start:11479 stop:12585 length:1107 start_codon:yes stop_codon:yes gene_type:complete
MSNDLYAPNKDDVKEAAAGAWLAIYQSLAPELVTAQTKPGKSYPCPVHGGKDGFRIFAKTAGSKSGGVCQQCGFKADGFALIQWVNNWGFHQTLQQVGGFLGVKDPKGRRSTDNQQPAKPVRRTQKDAKGPSNAWIINWLQSTWRQTVPLTEQIAEPARLYLRSRGILCWDREGLDRSIRFHPELIFSHENGRKETIPAIVALIRNESGKGITIHRIYLTHKGEKACSGDSKKMFAIPSDRTLVGGCIETSPHGEEVDICEGVETGLAIETATGMPVWPMVNAYLLANFIPREGTKRVYVWADKDRSKAGEEAARLLKDNLALKGIEVIILVPGAPIPKGNKGIDWNDMLLMEGKSAFQRRFSNLRAA